MNELNESPHFFFSFRLLANLFLLLLFTCSSAFIFSLLPSPYTSTHVCYCAHGCVQTHAKLVSTSQSLFSLEVNMFFLFSAFGLMFFFSYYWLIDHLLCHIVCILSSVERMTGNMSSEGKPQTLRSLWPRSFLEEVEKEEAIKLHPQKKSQTFFTADVYDNVFSVIHALLMYIN